MVRTKSALAFLLAALALIAGCKTPGLGQDDRIVQLSLITAPVALDLDGLPGPDGISVKIYAIAEGNPKPVPLRDGSLEVLMFDGPFQRQAATPPPMLKQFRLTAEELRAAEFTAGIGAGYQLFLPWGTNVPSQRIMSVAARYAAADGRQVLSRPSSVTVRGK